MEVLLGLTAILIVLAIPVAAIVALIKVVNLKGEVSALERRLVLLEAGTQPRGLAEPVAEPEAAPRQAPAPPEATPDPITTGAAAVEPGPTPAATTPPLPPVPAGPRRGLGDFEETFGTRWVVWVGGLALALGGIFLVRYAVESDLLGPGARLMLGALFATALVAAGEWLRRQDRKAGVGGMPAAYVPGVLTAAGTVAAYATVWAAYELYGFLSPAIAFVLLGLVAVATLLAALLHGPALAAIGTLGAYAAPALVSSDEPNAYALFVFVAVVTGAAYAVARVRLWRWLASTASALAIGWAVLYVTGVGDPSAGAIGLHVGAGLLLTALLIVPGLAFGPAPSGRRIDPLASVAPAAYAAVAALLAIETDMATAGLVVLGAALVAVLAIAWRAPVAAAAVPGVAALAAAVGFVWAIEPNLATTVAPAGATGAPEPLQALVWPMVVFASAIGAGFLGVGVAAISRQRRGLIAVLWAAGAVLAPTLLLAAAYYRIAGWVPSIPFGGLALVLAALFAGVAETTLRRAPTPGSRAAASVFVTGGLAALALGLTMMLERGWLTVALALVAFGAAYVAASRPYPFLRWVAAAAALLLAARLGWEPRIMGRDVGSWPIVNWLLWGYGVPAVALAAGAHLLRRARDDWPVRLLEGLSILFAVLLLTLEVRHLMNDGDVYARTTLLAEAGLQVSVLVAMALGLERARAVTGSIVHRFGAIVIAAVAVVGGLFALLLAVNPLLTNAALGPGLILNDLLIGYAIPTALCFVLYLVARDLKPVWLRSAAGLAALAFAFAYVSFEVAVAFRGERIGLVFWSPRISDGELYTYSAVWLAFGLALLAGGLVFGSKPARLASAAIIMLTVLKVFLADMADLEGVLRAVSFIGLGLVLVGIGWLYQHLVFRRGPPTTGSPPPAIPSER